jgi:hypothetical protein
MWDNHRELLWAQVKGKKNKTLKLADLLQKWKAHMAAEKWADWVQHV